jgi:hypothetical protein
MRLFRFIAILLCLTFVATSGFAAVPRAAALPAPHAWVATLGQSFGGFLQNLWSATVCGLDPLGRCTTQPKTDTGCRLDPLGRCLPAQPTTDTGCGLDPLGGCK